MKLIYVLILLVLYFWFYFNGPALAEWITGILILLIVLAKLLSGALGIGRAGAKELTRDMESDMEKAQPKPPSGEYTTEIIKEAGRKSGEYLGAPQDYVYKQKDLFGNLGQGAKNFLKGLGKIFRK